MGTHGGSPSCAGLTTHEVVRAAPIARTPHLIALKILSRDDDRREQDRRDLRMLIECATPQDLERARELLALITSRGYDRGRDLQTAFNTALREFSR